MTSVRQQVSAGGSFKTRQRVNTQYQDRTDASLRGLNLWKDGASIRPKVWLPFPSAGSIISVSHRESSLSLRFGALNESLSTESL
jgi:hypothetical protein